MSHSAINKGAVSSYIVHWRSGANGQSDSVTNTLENKLHRVSAFVSSVPVTCVEQLLQLGLLKSPILSLLFVLVLA